MKGCFQIAMSVLFAFAFSVQAVISEFRLDQDRIWLTVQNESLPRLLENFVASGIHVEMDPTIQKMIKGSWENVEIETVLDHLLFPYNYVLDWSREQGPHGDFVRLAGIRVFPVGCTENVKPLISTRRLEFSPDRRDCFMAREILVGFGHGSSIESLRTLLARMGGTVIATNAEIGVYRILLPEGTNVLEWVKRLENEDIVDLSEPNYVCKLPVVKGKETAISSEKALWISPFEKGDMAISVLDSGLIPDEQLNHVVIGSYDATNPNKPLTTDAVGHGTLMARLAAGLLDPFDRSAKEEGIPILAIKAFDDDGYADNFTLMDAISHAVKNSCGPISLSWGTPTPSKFIESAMNYARDHESIVIASAGNDFSKKPMYPAACPVVLSVGAFENGKLAPYSNYGDSVDIYAPGSAGGSQGTSIPPPAIANIIIKYQRKHPDASAEETIKALINAAGQTKFLSTEAVRKLLK